MTTSFRGRTVSALTKAFRRVRANPTAQAVGGRAAGRLRDSRTAREVVSRLFDVDVTGVGGSVFLSAGRLLAGQGLDNLPVVLVSLVGAPADEVPAILEEVAREQVLTGGFRPVIVLDADHFAEVRTYGYPVDLVVPEHAWGQVPEHAWGQVPEHAWGQDVPWRDYFRERLRSMRRGYGAVALVELHRPDDLGLEMLASMGGRS